MRKPPSKPQENKGARKRGLAPRSLVESDGRRSALESLDRPGGGTHVRIAFNRARLAALASETSADEDGHGDDNVEET